MQQHWCPDNNSAPGGPKWEAYRNRTVRERGERDWVKHWQRFDDQWEAQQAMYPGFRRVAPAQREHSYVDLTEMGLEKPLDLPRPVPAHGMHERLIRSRDSAHSLEELTKRQQKLDHLQRCLNRYEIERSEAGDAVKRIEQRLQELMARTTDLLESNTMGFAPQERLPTNRSSRSSRHPANSKTNHMYLDSDMMLKMNGSVPTPKQPQEFSTQYIGQLTPQRMRREREAWYQQQQPQAPSSSELREMQECYDKLSNHLIEQRGRLAKADSTVSNLIRALSRINRNRRPSHDQDYAQQPPRLVEDPDLSSVTPSTPVLAPTPIRAYPPLISMEANGGKMQPRLHQLRHQRNEKARLADAKMLQEKWNSDYIHLSQTNIDFPPGEMTHKSQPASHWSTSAFRYPPMKMTTRQDYDILTSESPLVPRTTTAWVSYEPPPPLPPKLARKMLDSGGPEGEEGPQQTSEDEEVSKLMSQDTKQKVNNTEVTNFNAENFSDPVTMKRPPPPPYYVNLLVPKSSTTDRLAHNKREEDGQDLSVSQDGPSLRKSDSGPTLGNAAQNSPKIYRHPLRANAINLKVYLEEEGHSLANLTTDPTEMNSKSRLPGTCFSSVLSRLFRANGGGSARPIRDKARTRSLDENSSRLSDLPSDLLRSPDYPSANLIFQVVLSKSRCEGYLWMASKLNRQRRRPSWQSIKHKGWSDALQAAFSPKGRGSPLVPKDTELQSNRKNRSWRLRWFVCDFDYRIVAYYGEQREDKVRESIPFASIRSIHDTDEDIPHFNPTSPKISRSAGLSDNEASQRTTEATSVERWAFGFDSNNQTYALRANSVELRRLWLAILRLAKCYGGGT